MSTVYHTCKRCGHEIEIDYDLGEHFAECSEDDKCEECGAEIVLDYNDLEEQAMSDAIERMERIRE